MFYYFPSDRTKNKKVLIFLTPLTPLSVIVIYNVFTFVFFLMVAFYVNIGPIRTYQQHIKSLLYLFDGGHCPLARPVIIEGGSKKN